MGRGPAVFLTLLTGLHRECLNADAVQMESGEKIGPAAGAGAKVLGTGMGFDSGWITSNQITGR